LSKNYSQRQEDGIHYFSDSTAAAVANETTIKIVFVLLTMSNWAALLT
jgi:hypothetical protein